MIVTIDSSRFNQNKIATLSFFYYSSSFIILSLDIKANVSAVSCMNMNRLEYLCYGSIVLVKRTISVNTSYSINDSFSDLTNNYTNKRAYIRKFVRDCYINTIFV